MHQVGKDWFAFCSVGRMATRFAACPITIAVGSHAVFATLRTSHIGAFYDHVPKSQMRRAVTPHIAGSVLYFIAVLACTTGSSTALAPDEPCSIDTVAFRNSEGCAKKMFLT
jgi:hypothetical protein